MPGCTAAPGRPCRGGASPSLKALLFADDFTGVATSVQELQRVVTTTKGWCDK